VFSYRVEARSIGARDALPNFPPHREIEEGLAVLRHRA
jgi:hypothetical protein